MLTNKFNSKTGEKTINVCNWFKFFNKKKVKSISCICMLEETVGETEKKCSAKYKNEYTIYILLLLYEIYPLQVEKKR